MRYHGVAGWRELVAQPRPRCAREATVRTGVLDSGVARCTWHRVILEGELPAGTRVEVLATGAESDALLEDEGAWIPQPEPVRRSHGHQPFTEPLGGSFELLLQGIEGRFARVALVLRSDGRCSPILRAMEVTAPRFSLRDAYLPAAYAEDDPASVLERFLANPEGEFTEIEGRIAAAQALLSPAAAPAEALPWLAGLDGPRPRSRVRGPPAPAVHPARPPAAGDARHAAGAAARAAPGARPRRRRRRADRSARPPAPPRSGSSRPTRCATRARSPPAT